MWKLDERGPLAKVMGKLCLFTVAAGVLTISGCCLPHLAQGADRGQSSDAVDMGKVPVKQQEIKAVSTGPQGCKTREEKNGKVHVRYGIPDAGDRGASLLLERIAPTTTPVGERFQYRIIVHNRTDCAIDKVTVIEQPADLFTPKATGPQAEVIAGRKLKWEVSPLQAGASKAFVVEGVAEKSGDIKNCATVHFTTSACTRTRAEQPELRLFKQMPKDVLLSDEIPIRLIVSNVGTGTARNVEVQDTLPAGLKSQKGQREFMFDAGDLREGQSREFVIVASAEETGTFDNKATARTESGLTATSRGTVKVRAPVLEVSKSGTEEEYVGRTLTYRIEAKNTGDAVAENVRIEDVVPDGMEFVSATGEGAYDDKRVRWDELTIPSGESVEVSLKLRGLKPGTFRNEVRVSGTSADAVSDSVASRVLGVAATMLEVVDETDPLEKGDEGAYIITVTNQGSAPGKNVRLLCNLEDNVKYVSSAGPTEGTAKGDVLSFAPLAELAPGDEAVWRVTVKAVKAGDVRFKTQLNSEQLSRPVQETEATTIY